MPDLLIKNKKFSRGRASSNLDLQMKEWASVDHFAGAIIDNKTDKKLEYRDLIKQPELQQQWSASHANKLGRLSQEMCDVPGTNTMFFIKNSDVPADRRKEVTYKHILVAYKPDRILTDRSRLTVGGGRIVCLIVSGSPTYGLITIKIP